MEEYILIATTFRQLPEPAIRTPVTITWAKSLDEAVAFAQVWMLDQAPPAEGWVGHTLRVERLAALRTPMPHETT